MIKHRFTLALLLTLLLAHKSAKAESVTCRHVSRIALTSVGLFEGRPAEQSRALDSLVAILSCPESSLSTFHADTRIFDTWARVMTRNNSGHDQNPNIEIVSAAQAANRILTSIHVSKSLKEIRQRVLSVLSITSGNRNAESQESLSPCSRFGVAALHSLANEWNGRDGEAAFWLSDQLLAYQSMCPAETSLVLSNSPTVLHSWLSHLPALSFTALDDKQRADKECFRRTLFSELTQVSTPVGASRGRVAVIDALKTIRVRRIE